MIEVYIEKLLCYGLEKGFFKEEDKRYVRNRLLEILDYHSYNLGEKVLLEENKEEILEKIIHWSVEKGVIEESYRDHLNAALMGGMLPRPSEVIAKFNSLYSEGPKLATEYLYNLSIDSNYIRKDRTDKNIKWDYDSEYGKIEITVNISKPEKDIKEIEKERNAPKTGYPLCLLCPENEGYSGRLNHPARQNLRIVPVSLGGERWFFQYSPYVYYDEHCILLHEEHIPMYIEEKTIGEILDFLDLFPHYFIGSNADLPIVGGSILNHHHFQGGNYHFPMDFSKEWAKISFKGFPQVEGSILKWPLSVIRLRSRDREKLQSLAGKIIALWKGYSDEEVEIVAQTDGVGHNTVTPIGRKLGDVYQLNLVLRNNRCNEEYPEGIFHPHREIHNIKKENIGLIEVMGLAVLPGRLALEIELMEKFLLNKELDCREKELLVKHQSLCNGLLRQGVEGNVKERIRNAIGEKFVQGLKHCGVFKDDLKGYQHFKKFVNFAGGEVVENP
ncbi:UTP-hexose-1-phosphate uridylyltransferase [Anaerobranca californiensis DSM 14826]|uniref:Galactose-1-phosphate uridylyltransferase n=1 Tax=Anaerobranca californiensis DSM 14826 TaxID=1120989 RepID=A0A1M6K6K3_9FIRM|nr:UDP-glucose--hexose-1-phosphate uridylyltransferase [Anaerobranca californiensis]SHJ54453.1 UTP-hexose-1-phosphate uridylyltransferase [Anaerobranca californiensis DSM 14826]